MGSSSSLAVLSTNLPDPRGYVLGTAKLDLGAAMAMLLFILLPVLIKLV